MVKKSVSLIYFYALLVISANRDFLYMYISPVIELRIVLVFRWKEERPTPLEGTAISDLHNRNVEYKTTMGT